MKLQIENTLKELKWDKKRNKMIDKDHKKRLLMMEDFVLNLCTRSSEVFKFCENSNRGFPYDLPTISVKDQHSEAYQKTLLYLEGIYQFVDFMVMSNKEDVKQRDQLKDELALCRDKLNASLNQVKLAVNEKEEMKIQCKDIIKQMQMVHEKCKFKTIHYKEVIRENKHLLARNKIVENELKICESKIAALTENLDDNKKYVEKMKRDMNSFKDKVHKMTIEINLLEKINIEQAIEDENIKEKLQQLENYLQCLKKHDQELYAHLSTCNDDEKCKYICKRDSGISFKYEAAKNLIKRMQLTIKKRSKELQEKTDEIIILKQKLTEENNKPCDCRKNEVVDCDGIIEENRRLWDGYFHLQLEQISIEKDIEITENKYQAIRDKLDEVNAEKHHINEENKINQEKLKEYLKIIEDLKGKHEVLEEKVKQLEQYLSNAKSGKKQSDTELSQLKTYLDQHENSLKEHELKFISLENEYLHAQELLEEYKKSFEKIEELLDSKTLEHKEKISALSEEIASVKNENDLLVSILGSPLVSCVVNAYIKMEELEECIENMMNLKICQLPDDEKSNNNYIENNNVIYEDKNAELGHNDRNRNRKELYGELKYKIEDLKVKCGDSIERIIDNANNKLEKYKMTLFDDGGKNIMEIETLMPSTYENIKLQISSVNI